MTQERRVRLDVLLVERGLAESRTRAQRAINEGKIRVDGEVQQRPGVLVRADAVLEVIEPLSPYVSRGALKLDHAIERFRINVRDRVALDVGASTGGFTQVLLLRGASRVFAVDVGTGQLHERLREDPRVVSLERCDIRDVAPGDLVPTPSLAVIDVSFISLTHILPKVATLLTPDGEAIALVKPQFEVGPGHVGKGGIVRDHARRLQALQDVIAAAERVGFCSLAHCDSPITGGSGNHEFLLHLRLRRTSAGSK